MKKNTKKPQEKRQRNNDSEMSSLNSSLGSFGLEPPKRYRPEQQQKETQPKKSIKNRILNDNQKHNRTLDELRKIENRRRKNAKVRRKILSYAALVVGIVAVIVVLCLTVFFKIETVTINGNKIYNKKEITAVLPIEKGNNLFLIDKDKASSKLEENLPYIYNAEIKRKIPSTIVVNITETPTVYNIKNPDKSFTLLDSNFKVLETSAKKKKNSISVTNAKIKTAIPGQRVELTQEKIQSNLLELTKTIETLKLDKITGIYSTDINNNFMVYDSRITLKLGTLDNLENKIYSALTAIEKLNDSNPQAEGTMTVTDNKQVYFTER